jgi:hypothetical protein
VGTLLIDRLQKRWVPTEGHPQKARAFPHIERQSRKKDQHVYLFSVVLKAQLDYVEDPTLRIAQHCEATYVRNVGRWNIRAAAE